MSAGISGRSAFDSQDRMLNFINDLNDLTPEIEHALEVYFDRFHPMFPVLKEHRIREGLQIERKHRLASFAALIDSILILVESKELLEAAAAASDTRSRTSSMEGNLPRPMGPRLTAMAHRSANVDALDVDTVMVAFHLFVAFEMHGEKLLAWYRLQEALTLLHMLGPATAVSPETEEHMRLLWIL